MAKKQEPLLARKRGRPRKSSLGEDVPRLVRQQTEIGDSDLQLQPEKVTAGANPVQDSSVISVCIGHGYLLIANASPTTVYQIFTSLCEGEVPPDFIRRIVEAVMSDKYLLTGSYGLLKANYCGETGRRIEYVTAEQFFAGSVNKPSAEAFSSEKPASPLIPAVPEVAGSVRLQEPPAPMPSEGFETESLEEACPELQESQLHEASADFDEPALEEDEEDYPAVEAIADDEEGVLAKEAAVEDSDVSEETTQREAQDEEVVSIDLDSMSKDELLNFCRQYHIPVSSDWSRERICEYLLQNYVE